MKMFTRRSFQIEGFIFLKKAFQKTTISTLLILLPAFIFSQEKTVEKANLAYKYKQYAQAAALYETAISEKDAKSSNSTATLNLKTKLAYCYRMNNKMNQAEALYAEIVKDERAKPDTYMYYGETLMSNGKYEEAKKWFLDYQTLKPDDKKAALMVANCDKVKYIEPYFPYVDIQEFAFNSDADDNAPVSWQNGIVFSSDRKQGAKFMKEKSGWTGRDYLDLYFSAIQDDGSYGEPRRFSSKLSEVNKNTGNASFASDGSEVFFTRNDNVLNKRETYNLQLYRSARSDNGKWKKGEKLSFCSPNYNFMHPAISPDGKELFFASDRKGEGGVDLWVSTRKGNLWSNPVNLGPTVNTSANEGFPFMDENGRLYFCSKGHPGYGGFDIFFTEMDEEGNWKTPQNLGQPINSPLDDISIYINVTGKNGMFTSSRGGGDDDIFFFEVLDETPADDNSLFSGIIPTATTTPEPFINKKPTAAAPQVEDVIPANQETPEPDFEAEEIKPSEGGVVEGVKDKAPVYDPAVPGVPKTYQPANQPATEEHVEIQDVKELVAEEQEVNYDPFSDLPIKEEVEEELPVEKETTSQSGNIFFDLPEEQPIVDEGNIPSPKYPAPNALFTFQNFIDKASESDLIMGEAFRIDGATFDPNIWQLTPKISRKLDDLVAVMRRFPSLQIELSAHTQTLGLAAENLKISQNRVNMAIEYMVKEGISADRIKGIGQGETIPLNHCLDGVTCSREEHLYNQRFEVRVLKGIEN